jgi:hypothetical protein
MGVLGMMDLGSLRLMPEQCEQVAPDFRGWQRREDEQAWLAFQ